MIPPAYPMGGGFMPSPNFGPLSQPVGHLPAGYCPPSLPQAVSALTPGLYRAACECRAIRGSSYGAVLANVLGKVSFAVSGNFRIRDRNGRSMPLSLHIRFAGARLSGKSEAHIRLNQPVIEAMKGWKKSRLFDNVLPPTLLRKIRSGSVLSMLSMGEGRGHLAGPLSRSFQDLSDLYDSNMPPFDRADDDDEALAEHAPDSAILVTCVNVQDDKNREWLDKYGKEAIESGYLFRLLMMESDELAIEGAGDQQPEFALLDYDHRIVELIMSARHKLQSTSVSKLPEIKVEPDAEQFLRQAQERFQFMASAALSPRDAIVFAVRLAANARRIAGCMHVFENYEGSVSPDTMIRAVTIAEYFGACWLATVFPPKPVPEVVQRGLRLLDSLCGSARQAGLHTLSCLKADVEAGAQNFGWSKAEMVEAITWICGQGFAQVGPRRENGHRVIKFELIVNPWAFTSGSHGYPPRLV
ncbi:YfjI family protein [Paraburkholderia sp. BCC1885]|uniref:YfjI family protein n=1 Tax=Paraburkholderia sp. BCC1885 TaxID=2562669 RepID=UPI0021B45EBE|nr:YfjI family protein [Paraburkholderia sp. BCC1885]